MSIKHETIKDPYLYYCFVALEGENNLPKFFVVPSVDVAEYVKWQHEHWLSTRNSPVKQTSLRRFRIAVEDPNQYLDNWEVFNSS
jgi:hypothetical protein